MDSNKDQQQLINEFLEKAQKDSHSITPDELKEFIKYPEVQNRISESLNFAFNQRKNEYFKTSTK